MREFREKFCRKNAQTGEYQPKWFVPEWTRYTDVESLLLRSTEKVWAAGRESVIEELNHEQEKLLDGFAHIKRCKDCASLRTETGTGEK